ncbi:hypothetical protein [Chiayiivirga flava]|uniref:Uncharacterized protein n=1 Tax=Chiayiivirga flava TaxID=659595 RepID=A0A7W8D6C1_9GAMM|nr:hypothetical protein [Chiayiivirga flava]MBB5208744.1 hypothetical protein [Chiayiivirga flava]
MPVAIGASQNALRACCERPRRGEKPDHSAENDHAPLRRLCGCPRHDVDDTMPTPATIAYSSAGIADRERGNVGMGDTSTTAACAGDRGTLAR